MHFVFPGIDNSNILITNVLKFSSFCIIYLKNIFLFVFDLVVWMVSFKWLWSLTACSCLRVVELKADRQLHAHGRALQQGSLLYGHQSSLFWWPVSSWWEPENILLNSPDWRVYAGLPAFTPSFQKSLRGLLLSFLSSQLPSFLSL